MWPNSVWNSPRRSYRKNCQGMALAGIIKQNKMKKSFKLKYMQLSVLSRVCVFI